MIACCHPGKIGDALYTLPTIRALSKKHNCKVDFYTSVYCEPILKLFEDQTEVNKARVLESYTPIDFSCGGQPWEMKLPNESEYEKVYQLGFRSVPDKPLPEFIAESVGLDRSVGNNLYYETRDFLVDDCFKPYVVLAPRGESPFANEFRRFLTMVNVPVYIIGHQNEMLQDVVETDLINDYTGNTFFSMVRLIKHCKAFVGILSGPLCIANGFNMKKVIAYNDSWDMRHSVYKPETTYIKNPTAEQIIESLGVIK